MKKLLTIIVINLLCARIAIAGEFVDYQVDKQQYQGYQVRVSSAKGLVLIIHDWDGLTDYEVKRAEMLGEAGYNAFAIDLYGKGNRPTEVMMKKQETARLYADRPKMRKLILEGLSIARGNSMQDAVVMGYCFGGAATLELARSGQATNVKGYASFHGGLATPDGQYYPKDTPPMLIAHGAADTIISLSDVTKLSVELDKANIDYTIEIYGKALHGFTVLDSSKYQAMADKKSWHSFLYLLQSVFK